MGVRTPADIMQVRQERSRWKEAEEEQRRTGEEEEAAGDAKLPTLVQGRQQGKGTSPWEAQVSLQHVERERTPYIAQPSDAETFSAHLESSVPESHKPERVPYGRFHTPISATAPAASPATTNEIDDLILQWTNIDKTALGQFNKEAGIDGVVDRPGAETFV